MDLDSDSSSLSEAPEEEVQKLAPIFVKAKKATKLVAPPPVVSPPRPKRPPSPPHELVLADNPDIAFIVMFRSRFQDAFPTKLPHFGPQDIERGVVENSSDPQMENLLCALLALVLNRKKPVERGHHGRALEEAVSTNKGQWPIKWLGRNPLHGGNGFSNMSPTERLDLLRTLAMWALTSSETIQTIIKEKYKQNRHNDDENQPLSVQPWGIDGDKRRYFLIQGLDDTSFRVYREGSRYTKNSHWYSMAGSIDEVKALSDKLDKEDGSQAARRLGAKMINAIPMFEATEEKRRRREYRQQRRAAFTRPEPGFGIYEGRTRGKRMRYTYDDDDAFFSDATSTRRSTRHQSGRSTPLEAGHTFTASGRQVKQPRTGEYGESLLSGNFHNSTDETAPEDEIEDAKAGAGGSDGSEPVRTGGRVTRNAGRATVNEVSNPRKRKHIEGYNSIDELSDEDDASASGDEWDSDKNERDDDEDAEMPDADDEDSQLGEDEIGQDDASEFDNLIVKLRLPRAMMVAPASPPPTSPAGIPEGEPKKKPEGVSLGLTSVPASDKQNASGDLQRGSSNTSKMNGVSYPDEQTQNFMESANNAASPGSAEISHINGDPSVELGKGSSNTSAQVDLHLNGHQPPKLTGTFAEPRYP